MSNTFDAGVAQKKPRRDAEGDAEHTSTTLVEWAVTYPDMWREYLAPALDLLSAVYLWGQVCRSLRELRATMMPHVPLTLEHCEHRLCLQALSHYGNQWYGQRFQYLSPANFQTFGAQVEVLVVRKCLVSTSCAKEMLRACPNLRALVVCESTALTRDILHLVAAHGKALRVLDLWGNLKISGWHKVLPQDTPVLQSLHKLYTDQRTISLSVVERMATKFPNLQSLKLGNHGFVLHACVHEWIDSVVARWYRKVSKA